MSPLLRRIRFQVEFAPLPKLRWARTCKLGLWRISRGPYPYHYRRMMAFERRNRTAPYLIADYPYRAPSARITDYLSSEVP